MTPEERLEADQQRRIRRQPVILLAVLNALVLAVGSTAALDLRRLQTPRGTSLAWVEAAVFGDCEPYLQLSVAAPGTDDRRSRAQVCSDLRLATRTARTLTGQIALRPGPVQVLGRTATATVGLTLPAGPRTVVVHLRRTGGRWRVVRDAPTCAAVGCG